MQCDAYTVSEVPGTVPWCSIYSLYSKTLIFFNFFKLKRGGRERETEIPACMLLSLGRQRLIPNGGLWF